MFSLNLQRLVQSLTHYVGLTTASILLDVSTNYTCTSMHHVIEATTFNFPIGASPAYIENLTAGKYTVSIEPIGCSEGHTRSTTSHFTIE